MHPRTVVVRNEDAVEKKEIRQVVVLTDEQCDSDPRHARNGDLRDAPRQVSDTVAPLGGAEMEAGEVETRDREQQMRAAPDREELDV